MTPTCGRIVWFHDLGNKTRPAIILRVLPAPSPDTPETLDLGVFSDMGYGYIPGVREGSNVGRWSWPILVPA